MVATGPSSPEDMQQVRDLVTAFFALDDVTDTRLIDDYFAQHPESVWQVGLLTNLGGHYYNNGAFSQAIDAWEQAWQLGQSSSGKLEMKQANRAFAELVRMHAKLGHADRLEQLLLVEGRDRDISGSALQFVRGAHEGLAAMRLNPGVAYLCGPAALSNVLYSMDPEHQGLGFLAGLRSGPNGFNLQQVNDIAGEAGMDYRMAKREPGAAIPVPSVVHWNVNHYAAIVDEHEGNYHIKDPTFGRDLWVSEKVLEQEASGYFVVPVEMVGEQGWQVVASAEAESIYGRGLPSNSDDNGTTPCDDTSGGSGADGEPGMPVYRAHSMLVSLNIVDTPVDYTPPYGPKVNNTLVYNQRESNQPGIFPYVNLGSRWTAHWISFILDNPDQYNADVKRITGGGGAEIQDYDTWVLNSSTGEHERFYLAEACNGSKLVRTQNSPPIYERTLADGSIEIFSYDDGAVSPATERRVFLTSRTDPFGHTINFTYETITDTGGSDYIRLKKITDALGQDTTLTYRSDDPDVLPDALQVSVITDPFSRTAQVGYDSNDQVNSITDAAGIVSTFTYSGTSDFIDSMTTPYGTSTFDYGDGQTTKVKGYADGRWLEMTDPEGETERLQFINSGSNHNIPTFPASPLPPVADMYIFDRYRLGHQHGPMNHGRNTLYWDQEAHKEYEAYYDIHQAVDYQTAVVKHWLHNPYNNGSLGTGRYLESIKKPNENRVWFNYPGQSDDQEAGGMADIHKPSKIGRVLDDGTTTQIKEFTYNDKTRITCRVNGEGDTFAYEYFSNDIDLQYVKRRNDGIRGCTAAAVPTGSETQAEAEERAWDTVAEYAYYPETTYSMNHLVETYTDGEGNETDFTYNNEGQVKTVTNALGQETEYNYDNDGYLLNIKDKENLITLITFTYDSAGRIATATNAAGYVETYSYDNLNRLTGVSYPGSTSHSYGYLDGTDKMLDLEQQTDRYGDEIDYTYDGQRNLTDTEIYDGTIAGGTKIQAISYGYYANGKLKTITHGDSSVANDKRSVTTFERDGQSRVTQVRLGTVANADPGTHETDYTYESTISRLKKITHPDGGETEYSYDRADRLSKVIDANNLETHYHYNAKGELEREDSYDRGTLVYAYDLAGNLTEKKAYNCESGTGFHSALSSCTLIQTDVYTYDALNRLATIDYDNDSTIDLTYCYDSYDSGIDPLVCDSGSYDHGKVEGRLARVAHSDDSTYDYKYDSYGRLEKESFDPDGSGTLSAFDTSYSYNSAGELTAITNASGYTIDYTRSDSQLTAVDLSIGGQSASLVNTISYQPFGGIKQYTNELTTTNDLVLTRAWNMMGQYTQLNMDINNDDGYDIDYGYDGFGNINSITDAWAGTEADQDFTYDAMHRLTQATGIYGQYDYTYDKVGNRKTRQVQRFEPAHPTVKLVDYTETYYYDDGTGGGATAPSPYASNRLMKLERHDNQLTAPNTYMRRRSFVYDDRGNTTEDKREILNSDGSTASTTTLSPSYGDNNRMESVDVTP